jgi:hypothetical protein
MLIGPGINDTGNFFGRLELPRGLAVTRFLQIIRSG